LKNWNDAFAVGAYIKGADVYPPLWAQRARAYRQMSENSEIDLRYGDEPSCRYDLFVPANRPRGLAVFVHGGYWMEFDKSSWSHLAKGACDAGWAVAIPSYTLAPAARIHEITAQIGQSITAAALRVNGPISLAGHSAGGHLVTRMACENAPIEPKTRARLSHVLSISGLHDLRNLCHTTMNNTLRLTKNEAADESAALQSPMPDIDVTTWVGADERPEFFSQAQCLKNQWHRRGCVVNDVVEPGRHPFDILTGLEQKNSPITRAFIGST